MSDILVLSGVIFSNLFGFFGLQQNMKEKCQKIHLLKIIEINNRYRVDYSRGFQAIQVQLTRQTKILHRTAAIAKVHKCSSIKEKKNSNSNSL